MRANFSSKLYFSMALPFLLICFIIPIASPSKAVLAGGSNNNILISCPDYVKGIQTVNVYSNITSITSYDLKVDGSTISHLLNLNKPRINSLYCTNLQSTSGTITRGNATSLNLIDGKTLMITASRAHHHSYQVALYLDFSINNLDPNAHVSAFNYSISLNMTTTATIEICVKNNSRYIDLAKIQGSALTKDGRMGNVQVSSTIDAFDFEVLASANNPFSLSIDLFRLNYALMETMRSMQIIDSQELNTTSLSDGSHLLQVEISYYAGHASASKTIVVDNTAPEFASIKIDPVIPVDNSMTAISGSVVETNLIGTELRYTMYNETIVLESNDSNFRYEARFPNGSIPVVLVASDEAGNIMSTILNLNVTHAMEFVYVDLHVLIYARTNVTVGDIASIMVNITRVDSFDVFVNGTYNETFNRNITLEYSEKNPCTFHVQLDFYVNGTIYLQRTMNVTFNLPEPAILRNINIVKIPVIHVNESTSVLNGTMNFLGNVTITCLNDSRTWQFINVSSFAISYKALVKGFYAFNITISVHDTIVYNSVQGVYSIEFAQQTQEQPIILYIIIAGLAVGLLGTGIAYNRK